MAVSTYLSIITLHVNGFNAPVKRAAEWIQKQGPYICCYKSHLRSKDTHRLTYSVGNTVNNYVISLCGDVSS